MWNSLWGYMSSTTLESLVERSHLSWYLRARTEARRSSHKRPGEPPAQTQRTATVKALDSERSLLCSPREGCCAWTGVGGDRPQGWAGGQRWRPRGACCRVLLYCKGGGKALEDFEQGLACSEFCFKEMVMAPMWRVDGGGNKETGSSVARDRWQQWMWWDVRDERFEEDKGVKTSIKPWFLAWAVHLNYCLLAVFRIGKSRIFTCKMSFVILPPSTFPTQSQLHWKSGFQFPELPQPCHLPTRTLPPVSIHPKHCFLRGLHPPALFFSITKLWVFLYIIYPLCNYTDL